MSDTHDIIEEFSAYLDGELGAAEAARVEAAVRSSRHLAEQLRGLAGTRELLRALPRARADEGFAAGVLARAKGRALLLASGEEASKAGLWLGRISAAAVLLLAAGVGAVVFRAVWKDAPRARVAAHPDGEPLLLAKLPSQADRWGRGARLAGRFGRRSYPDSADNTSGAFAASRRVRGKPSAAPDDARPHVEAAAGIEQFARLKGPLDAYGEGPAVALKELHDGKVVLSPAGKDGRAAHRVELRVTDLGAGRREVEAILSAAGVRPLEVARGALPKDAATRGPASAGKRIRFDERKRKGVYHQASAGPRTWQAAVMDSPDQLARIVTAVGDIRAAVKETAYYQRLCLPATVLSRSGTAVLPPVSAAPPRPKAPVSEAERKRYHAALLERLQAPQTSPAEQARASATAPARDVLRLLVITLHLEAPTRPATQMIPRPEPRQTPATNSAAH